MEGEPRVTLSQRFSEVSVKLSSDHTKCCCRVHTPFRDISAGTRVSALVFSPIQRAHILSCGTSEADITLWDVEMGEEVQRFCGHKQRIWSLAFSLKQPTVFASASDDCSLRLWSTEQPRSTLSITFDTNVCCVAASPWDGHMFAAGTAGHCMSVYDTRYPSMPISNFPGVCPI
jgi:protein suppressor of PHYA-105 1